MADWPPREKTCKILYFELHIIVTDEVKPTSEKFKPADLNSILQQNKNDGTN